jgi:hypothetical protein
VFFFLLGLLLTDTVGLGLVNSQFVVSGGVLLELLFKLLAFTLQAGSVGGKSLELGLGGHRLLEEDFNLVKSVLLVVELSADNII